MATIQDLPSGEALSSARPKIVSNFTALNTELGQKETPAGAQDKADAVAAYPRTKGGTYYAADYGQISDTLAVSHLAIQAAMDTAYADGGGTVVLPRGKILNGASVILRSGVSVRGVMPKAPTIPGDNFWETRYSYTYSMLGATYSGGTVFSGGASLEVFSYDGDNYLTGVELSHFGVDGPMSAFRVGATDKYGAAWCHFHHIVLMNNASGYAFNVINSQQLRLEYLFALKCAGFLAWQSLYVTEVPRASGSSGNSSICHCMSQQGVAGNNISPIWINADGGPVASLVFTYIQSNRLQVSASATTVPNFYVQGRNRTTSVCQSIKADWLDLEGYCLNQFRAEYADMIDVCFNAVDTHHPSSQHVAIVESNGLWKAAIQTTVSWDGKYNNQWAGIVQSFSGAKMPGCYWYNADSQTQVVGIASGANTYAQFGLDYGIMDFTKGVGLGLKERLKEVNATVTVDKFYAGTVRLTGSSTYAVTMDPPANTTGIPFRFVKEGASGTVTINAALLGGGTSFAMSTQKQWVHIRSNGTAYVVESMGTATI